MQIALRPTPRPTLLATPACAPAAPATAAAAARPAEARALFDFAAPGGALCPAPGPGSALTLCRESASPHAIAADGPDGARNEFAPRAAAADVAPLMAAGARAEAHVEGTLGDGVPGRARITHWMPGDPLLLPMPAA